MYLKSKNKVKTINKDAILIKDNKYVVYLIENNIAKIKPMYVATPLPPLNFNQKGNKCPSIAILPNIYVTNSLLLFE